MHETVIEIMYIRIVGMVLTIYSMSNVSTVLVTAGACNV